ncbi:MAG TPA: hypothetical protein DFR83_08235 [Deltaproteobacteria bacterium]|nr:hypothetical protein [Deltaproteobacteria bacterium]
MQLSDPFTTALDVQSRMHQKAWWTALPGLLRAALGQWPGHPELIDAVIALALHEPFVVVHGMELIPVCTEAARAVSGTDAAPLLTHAAQLTWMYDDTDGAWRLLVDALSAAPDDVDARTFLSELLETPDQPKALCDSLETLAMRAVRGQVDRASVLDILTECRPVSACPRAWSLLGL